ncbi:hypothetical protein VFPPC_09228 [Pochonia chlamydosporia 170]|uniref:Tat pathway signal sequence n=1 Tax=Pochonia chlamydosporia 170 TaxID=1380566 RepID=A0A179FE67_METCM|nr:hypothetical protein VFPPC_09228 [Pochonia chlamydosporia 170]OAQ63373.1 hypothetical protein VFPPC_09228 [Pochonia chlamydosporia 170]
MSAKLDESTEYGRVYSDSRSSKSSESLPNNHAEETLLHGFLDPRPASRPWRLVGFLGLTIINTLLLVATLVTLTRSGYNKNTLCSEQDCAIMTSLYSPLLEPGSGAIEYEHVMFQGALDHKSIYKGTPNKDMDEAWTFLTHKNNSIVTGDVLDRIGKSRSAVKYTEDQEPGGMYFVGIEVFHQLHCLNLVRQFTYRDYYNRAENKPEAFTDSEGILRKHVDHCIDMLRQAIICHGDAGIVT